MSTYRRYAHNAEAIAFRLLLIVLAPFIGVGTFVFGIVIGICAPLYVFMRDAWIVIAEQFPLEPNPNRKKYTK